MGKIVSKIEFITRNVNGLIPHASQRIIPFGKKCTDMNIMNVMTKRRSIKHKQKSNTRLMSFASLPVLTLQRAKIPNTINKVTTSVTKTNPIIPKSINGLFSFGKQACGVVKIQKRVVDIINARPTSPAITSAIIPFAKFRLFM